MCDSHSHPAHQCCPSPVEFSLSRRLFLLIPLRWLTHFISPLFLKKKNKAHTVALNFHHHPDYLLLPPNRAFQVAKDGRKNKVESGHPFRNQLTQLPSPQREHNLLGRQGIFFSSGFLIRVVLPNRLKTFCCCC